MVRRMAETDFIQPDSAPVITSSLDSQPDVRDHLERLMDDVLSKPVEEPPPSAPTVEGKSEAKPEREEEPVELLAKPEPKPKKRRLSEITHAPTESEISESIDRPAAEVDAKAKEPEDQSDLDLDRLEPHPAAGEENKSHFKQLKEAAKTLKEANKAYEAKIAPVAEVLGITNTGDPTATLDAIAQRVRELKSAPATPPEDTEALAKFRLLSRSTNLNRFMGFENSYGKPIKNAFADLVSDIAANIPNAAPEQMAAWRDNNIRNYAPEKLTGSWLKEHLDKIPDELAKRRVETKAGQMSSLMQERNRVHNEIVADGTIYEQFVRMEADNQKLAQQEYTKNWEASIRDETEKAMKEDQFKEIAELRQQALSGENPQATAHYGKLEKAFVDTLVKINSGPRQLSRIAMEYLAQKEQLADYKKTKDELAKYKKRLGVIQKIQVISAHGAPKPTKETPKLSKENGRAGLADAFREWVT
jgi:hypothetical protein